ncbi:MAG: (2Fe-2S) ferredoxin domain-containing protein [Chloroflexi bacterium]|nr:(2Fe-2S) ferredoxin domain-containing protein [Chloroflexota bacterium]
MQPDENARHQYDGAATAAERTVPDLDQFTHWAFICEASDCRWRGSPAVRNALAEAVQRQGGRRVAVVRTGCLSLCGAGPAVVTYPAGEVHLHVEPADAPEMAAQLAGGSGLKRRLVRAPQWYRDAIVSRLGYMIELLKRRAAARGRAPQPSA